MDTTENPVLEPRSERIARYKAERRRELAERFGSTDERPSKWVRWDGKEGQEHAGPTQERMQNSDGFCERMNGATQKVTNGVEMDPPADSDFMRPDGPLSGEAHLHPDGASPPQLRTRVSVGQLRSALLQQTESGAQPEKAFVYGDGCETDAGRCTSSLDLAVKAGSDGGRRRTRRYVPGGSSSSRKTSERFRTQPITTNEMEESCGMTSSAPFESSKVVHTEEEQNKEADVKTDDRAKMSVAAKMSLFKELEKSAAPEASVLPKPRSSSISHERRARRGNDQRFLTQPITCEEMVAISAPAPVEVHAAQTELVEEDDASCKMSVSEKLALFNKLSLPVKQEPGPADGPLERRRQKGARYRTQPITVEEVNILQKVPIQLPALSLPSQLAKRQQTSSVHLKPSEVCVSLQRPQTEPDSNPEAVLKGILKKSRSASSEWSRTDGGHMEVLTGHQQNGGELDRSAEVPRAANVEGGSGTAAPWRQRARNRKETRASTLLGSSSKQDVGQEEMACKVSPREHSSFGRNGTDAEGNIRRSQENEEHKERTNDHLIGSGCTSKPLGIPNTNKNEESLKSHPDDTSPQHWNNLTFEVQEVSSPTKTAAQPQWRQKARGAEQELKVKETEEKTTQIESREQQGETSARKASLTTSSTEEAKEDTPARGSSTPDGDFCRHQSPPPPACVPRPCGTVTASETEQDVDIFCLTNTPILSSAVAEHRRAVRPSRRTQGSRNPLRALAAREDVSQDYMGERSNSAAEERGQAEKKCKNSPAANSHPATSEGSISAPDAESSYPPFKNLMLIHIKGRRHVQVRLVQPSVQSLNSGDCYLLVNSEHCIVWIGEFSNQQERAKASELALLIHRNKDLGCKASQVIHLEEGPNSDSGLDADFWSLLGARVQCKGAGAPEEDDLYEQGVVESNCVYRLVDTRLVPHEEAWATSPSSSVLDPTETFVFDFGSEVYLWHGRDVSLRRRDVALQLTQQLWAGLYDYSNCPINPLDPTRSDPDTRPRGEGRPSWALLAVVSQDNETSLFKEKFQDWRGRRDEEKKEDSFKDETQLTSPLPPHPGSPPSDLLSPCDAKALVSGESTEGDSSLRTVLAGVDVQRGHGVLTLEGGHQMKLTTAAVDTWHVQEFDDSEIPVESSGQLHEGDSYAIRWTYTINTVESSSDESTEESKQNIAFFLWRGHKSSVSRRDTAALLSIGMTNQEESQVVVHQGKEPPCFLQLFQGGLVIHKGKREDVSTTAAEWRLFCVRGQLPEEGSLLEVDCSCAGLRSRGSVVLLNSQQRVLFLWTGCKAHSNTREVSKRAVERLTAVCPPELGLNKNNPVKVHLVEEGSEPAEFWTALGPMERKAYDCMLQDPGKYNFTPRLFHLSASSGSFKAEELQSPTRLPGLVMAMPFVQEILYAAPQPALFLLDNRLEVYLWQRGQPEKTESSTWGLWQRERKCAMQTALQYCKEINPKRPPQAYLIFEGSEPLTFTNIFPCWEKNLRPHPQGETQEVKLTLVQDALTQLMKTQYPVEELQKSPIPEGVDPQQLEVYLSDQDFQSILEMRR